MDSRLNDIVFVHNIYTNIYNQIKTTPAAQSAATLQPLQRLTLGGLYKFGAIHAFTWLQTINSTLSKLICMHIIIFGVMRETLAQTHKERPRGAGPQ